ncbi:MAG: TyeA family type III secretion system gatekeeper subunit [Kluyvera sp.]|uniref:TyeA family type III secretion system gatekeeper subunit n=1 Tax=Kluyvera sp. TaxID=1538228 RepID=UPI003F2C8195
MSQIDNLGTAFYRAATSEENDSLATNRPQQIIPASLSLQSELQDIRQSSLMETMESMSLVMGGRLRQNGVKKEAASSRSDQLQDMLLRWVPKVEGQRLVELVERFSMLGAEGEDPIAKMQQGGVPDGAMVLLLASLLGNGRLDQKRRRRLEDALAFLLEDDAITLDALAWLEPGMMTGSDLLPLRQLYQRTRREDQEQPQGMSSWFSEVQEWPDRRARLRVIIRALALDLKRDADNQPVRIASAIGELKRLLLFFSMEEHCAFVAQSVNIAAEYMLSEVLLLLEQSWIYPDWIASRMSIMGLCGDRAFIWIYRMLELLRFIPGPCFLDEDQCDQLIEAFTQLQEQLENQEQI